MTHGAPVHPELPPGRCLAAVALSLAVVALGFTPWSFDILALKQALFLTAFPALVLSLLAARQRFAGLQRVALVAATVLTALGVPQILTGVAASPLAWALPPLLLLPVALWSGWSRSGLQTTGLAPVPLPLLAVAGLVLLGCFHTTASLPGMAATAGLRQDLGLLALIVAALMVRSSFWERPRILMGTCTAIGSIVAGLAVAQKLGIDPFGAVNPGREAVSTFGNTNAAAGFLAPLFVLSLMRASVPSVVSGRRAERDTGSEPNRAVNRWQWAATALMGTGLALMESRGAALAAIVGVIFGTLWLVTHPERAGWKTGLGRRVVAALLAPVAIGMLVLIVRARGNEGASPVSPAHPTTQVRLRVLQDTAAMIAANPWLGHGPGSFRVVFPLYRSPELAAVTGRFGLPTEVDHPHNDYLWLAAERGLPAAALWIAAIIALIVIGWRATRASPDPGRGFQGGAVTAAFVTLVTSALTFPVLFEAAPALLLFILAGTILAFKDPAPVRPGPRFGPRLAGAGLSVVLLVTLAHGSLAVASRLLMAHLGMTADLSSPDEIAAMNDRLESAVALDPTNVDAARFRASTLMTLSLGPDGDDRWGSAASRALTRLQASLPHESYVPESRAVLALLAGNPRRAERNFRLAARLLQGGPGPAERLREAQRRLAALGRLPLEPGEDAVERARSLHDAGRSADAKRLLDSHLQEHPGDGDALHLLGLILRDQDDVEEAEKYMRQAQLAFAIEWILKREWDRAAKSLRIAGRYSDRHDEERALEALILLLQGDREGAIRRIGEGGLPDFDGFPSFVRRAVLPVERLVQ